MSTRAPQRGRAAGAASGVSAATSLASLVTLMVLTFGLPGALVVFGRDLVPSTVVRPAVMWAALQKPDDGHLFLQGLYLAAWVGWFFFFLSVFLEIVAQVQHRAAVRLPGLGWLQRGVGTLVTAAVVIVGSPVAAMAATPGELHGGAGTVATAQAFGMGVDGARQGAYSRAAPSVGPPYVVRAGDSLWRIAQEQLGDPNRFEDIARLNDGRVMPDGSVFHYSEFLHAGWVLLMPPDAGKVAAPGADQAAGNQAAVTPQSPAPVSNATNGPAPRTYTVRSGDSLSSIAKAQLGDARRWDELFELNKGKPQPGGPPIWRADLIWPGDVLILPADASSATQAQSVIGGQSAAPSTQAQPASPQQSTDASQARRMRPEPANLDSSTSAVSLPSGGLSGTNQQAAPSQMPTSQAPSTQASGNQMPGGQPSAGQSAQAAPSSEPREVTFTAPTPDSSKTIGTVGGLLAAGLLSTLGAKRLARIRRRRPGQRIAVPPPDDWELELRTVENPTGRVFIDAALRTLSARLAEVDRILPDLAATVLKPHGLELHLTRMEPPVTPFYADPARPGVWVCPLGAPLLTEDDGAVSQAPYPALVSLGFDEGDDSVLVDLESTRGLSLLAPTNESVAMLRALAVELATGAWADQLVVTLVGFGEELPELFTPGCLTHTPDLAGAVDELVRWSAQVEAVLDKRDVSLREARTYSDAELASVTKTHMLLSAVPLDARSAYRLRQMLSGHQRTSTAVAAVVQDPDHLLSPWAVTGPSFQTPQSQVGGPGLHIRMQALRDEQYHAIVRDLSGADLDDEWASAQRHGFGSGSLHPGTPPSGTPRPTLRPATPPVAPRTKTSTPSLPPASAPAPTPAAHPKPPKAAPVPTPEPAAMNRFRIPVDDLFRISALPPSADPATVGLDAAPPPGAASKARHALNPANLPQFDLVVTPWHGDAITEQILAVPNAAPPAHAAGPKTSAAGPGQDARKLGLTTFAGAGSLAGAGVAPPHANELTHELPAVRPTQGVPGDEASDSGLPGRAGIGDATGTRTDPDPDKRPGQWQTAYWSQRKAARSQQQNFDVDPVAMARTVDILGPIDLSGTPATAGSRAADLAEVAAFVVLHPGCSANQIAAELWPGRKGAVAIRDAQVARLREWLGTDAYGEEHLQVTPDGYFMGPSVSCDWLEFLRRVQSGELVSAISLVRGRPFQDAPLRRYGWAEGLRHEMTALIIDTAHYVAEACLRENNPRGAQNAAYRGLQAAPESELLYRDLLTALAEQGDLAAARQHADTLIAYADREGIDLQPETTELLRDVLQAVPGG